MKDIQDFLQSDKLLKEISILIDESQLKAVVYANSVLTQLFWQIGTKINRLVLENQRADYGKQIVVALSRQLSEKYGRNFEEKNLRRILQFAIQFSDFEIVVTLSRQLSWSHFLILLPIKQNEAKIFYIQQIISENLSIRNLRKQISDKTYERTSIANIQNNFQSSIPLNTFKDPYLLDFLKLDSSYLEKDLENAILKEFETFILELRKGFSFVERQKRMIIDNEDYYLDLLFYHRKLKRLVAVELKFGKFQAKTQRANGTLFKMA